MLGDKVVDLGVGLEDSVIDSAVRQGTADLDNLGRVGHRGDLAGGELHVA